MDKVAAIWWRVSTESQKEISPQTQISEALALAQQEGYRVPEEYIIGTDWHSLSVWDSPPMDKLKELVRSKAIQAVFMYDADRGPSKPAHRLLLRALCEEHFVRVRSKFGQAPDGETGELIEFLNAWAKEKQVLRTQQGARDGLRDRARIKKLPVNGRSPYGYKLNYEIQQGKKIPTAFHPDPVTYPVAQRIWQMALAGKSLRGICLLLNQEHVPGPTGGPWRPPTVHYLLDNPLYAGLHQGLRRARATPKNRRGQTYGKTGSAPRQQSEWVTTDFPVTAPVVSLDEWRAVHDILQDNKLESQRNHKANYLLSGFLFCARDGRSLRGLSYRQRGRYYYCCTLRPGHSLKLDPCALPKLSGPELETEVWEGISGFLGNPQVFMAEMDRRKGGKTQERQQVEEAIRALGNKLAKMDGMDAEVVSLKVRGTITESVFERSMAYNKAERVHYQEELERERQALAALDHQARAMDSMKALAERVRGRLESATPEEKRWLLRELGVRVTVSDSKSIISIEVPGDPKLVKVSSTLDCAGTTPVSSPRPR